MRDNLQGITVLLIIFNFIVTTAYAQPVIASNTDEAKVPAYSLPDVLRMKDGRMVTSAAQWMAVQRPYLYNLYEQVQFGIYPKMKPAIHYQLLEQDKKALDGKATRGQVRIQLHPGNDSVYIDVLLYLPNNGQKKHPVFVGYNFSGNHTVEADPKILLAHSWVDARSRGSRNNRATDSSRGSGSSQWQVKEILAQGFGLVTAYYGDLEPDHKDGWKDGIRTSLKDVLSIDPSDWSAMGAWAYGLSRIMDYLQKEGDIDHSRVALIGHSRLGKAALWAAASDPRFSLIISNESGEGGAALSKRWYGETVKIINEKFPHWFGRLYKTYGDNTDSLPVDGHMLLSLLAPRPLYVASAEGDTWSDPKGEFLGAKEAGRVYALFGKKGIGVDQFPGLHQPVGHTVQYHVRAGRHDVTPYDWQQYLRFAQEQWK
jgi:hypothetical protein